MRLQCRKNLSRTEEPAKAGTSARDRRALQKLALNVHIKHSDLTKNNTFNEEHIRFCPSLKKKKKNNNNMLLYCAKSRAPMFSVK